MGDDVNLADDGSGRYQCRVDTGNAEIFAEPDRDDAWSLFVNDVAQSYVDLADPTHLEFDYARWVGSVIDSLREPGDPIRALHLGGGALTLPRYVAATRPGSAQVVAELDRRLVDLVLAALPLPTVADVRVIVGDAAAILAEQPDDEYDLVIADAYRAAALPDNLAGTLAATQAARVLVPGGTYVVNVIDNAPYRRSRAQAAILRESFADSCVVAGHDVPPHPRFNNIVLAASTRLGGLATGRIRKAAVDHDARTSLLRGGEMDAFIDP